MSLNVTPTFQIIDNWAAAAVNIVAQFGIRSTVEDWRMAHCEGRRSIVVDSLETMDGRIRLPRPIRVFAPAPAHHGPGPISPGNIYVQRVGARIPFWRKRVSSPADVIAFATS